MDKDQLTFERKASTNCAWPSSLLISTGLFLLIAAGTEIRARRAGYQIQYPLVDDAWTAQWFRLESLPDDQTVLIGASRMQYGMHLDTWEQLTGERPLMLAWPGAPFTPVLSALAKRESFRGKVYCGIAPSFSFAGPDDIWVTGMNARVNCTDQKRISLDYHLAHHLRMALYNHLRFLNPPAFSPLVNTQQRLRLPDRQGTLPPLTALFCSYFDHELQFRHTPEMETNDDLQQQVKDIFITVMEGQRYSGTCDMSLLIRQTIIDIRAIEARGGKVVFVRFPSDGGFLNFESQYYPRVRFWDRLVSESGCQGIHFQDYPELKHFLCPEWSHLAEADAIQFTERFLNILNRKSALGDVVQ